MSFLLGETVADIIMQSVPDVQRVEVATALMVATVAVEVCEKPRHSS